LEQKASLIKIAE